MKSVRIAELKSRLSEYLRAVRNGATVTVLDRNTPVAKIIPINRLACGFANPPLVRHLPKACRGRLRWI